MNSFLKYVYDIFKNNLNIQKCVYVFFVIFYFMNIQKMTSKTNKQKRLNKHKNSKKKQQHGGIRFKKGFEGQMIDQIFWEFIKNSEISIFSTKTRGGILFEATLNDHNNSPYEICRSNAPFQRVKSLLLKMVIFSEIKLDLKHINISLNKCHEDDFVKEVQIQNDIFTRTLNEELEPICPSIVYHEIMSLEGFNLKIKDCNNDFVKQLMSNITNTLKSDTKVGILAMEKMEGFIPLMSYVDTLNEYDRNTMYFLACFEFIRFYELGYLHGDFHLENMLVNPNYEYIKLLNNEKIFENLNNKFSGRVILIDFGASFTPEIFIKQEKLPKNYYYYVLKQNYLHISPVWMGRDSLILQNHEAYQWINTFFNGLELPNKEQTDNFNKNSKINTIFQEMIKGRTLVASVFLSRMNNPQIVGGGQVNTGNPQIFQQNNKYDDNYNYQNDGTIIEAFNKTDPKYLPQDNKYDGNYNNQNVEKIIEAFNKTDPEYLLNKINVDKYVYDENTYAKLQVVIK